MFRSLVTSLAAAAVMALATAASAQQTETATFASGCFWCTESDFEKVPGVIDATSGYLGGKTANPTYKEVSAGGTGHTEGVEVKYDPSKVTYQQLLDVYWKNVDPFDKGGQFCDRGDQYRPAIFYHNDEQKRLAEESKASLEKSGRFKDPIVVEITQASTFTKAEDYHQNYADKNPIQYIIYRHGCGRDARLQAIWGKPAS
ncbi:peptide-methionine (S)-S-oxide reductase MsrA [Leptospira interrogans]